jgi:hypothetical protein
MTVPLCVVTGADDRFFAFLRGAIESVPALPAGRSARLAVFDFGLTPEQRAWVERHADALAAPDRHHEFPGRETAPGWLRGLLARPVLRDYFLGADVYLWLGADAFVLDGRAIELFVRGARARGLAIVPEMDRGSRLQYGLRPAWWRSVARWYGEAFGPQVAEELQSFPLLNAGVFAIHRSAPHWSAWNQALERTGRHGAQLMTDQMALNYAIFKGGLFARTELLPAWCNWGIHLGPPSWDLGAGRLVEPHLPHTPIGILHCSGINKSEVVPLPCVSGGTAQVRMRFPPEVQFPEFPSGPLLPGDYVSAGLKVVMPDACFPNMTAGDPSRCAWPHLRKEIPHRWYVDKRGPNVGFVSRDEAQILYNTALRFRGKRALEIGCWLGWSTCHLALAGVSLDALDPGLANPAVRESVEASLTAVGVRGLVNLVAASSPEGLVSLAGGRKWSLFFVDGDHEGTAPTRDAEACAEHAEEDALILFHDLAAPAVGAALDRLRELGWHTVVYSTMQIMGAAWRGSVAPVAHRPDPSITSRLPAHLHGHPTG